MIATFPPLTPSGGYMPDDAGDEQAFADMLRPLLADARPVGGRPVGPDVDGGHTGADEPRDKADMSSAPSEEVELADVSEVAPTPHPEARERANSDDDAPPEQASSTNEGNDLAALSNEVVPQKEEPDGVPFLEVNRLPNNENTSIPDMYANKTDSIMPPVLAASLTARNQSAKGQIFAGTEGPQVSRTIHANLRLVRSGGEAVASDSVAAQKNAADVGSSESSPAIPPRPTVGDNFVAYSGPLLANLGFDLTGTGLAAASGPEGKAIAYPDAEESQRVLGLNRLALGPDMPEAPEEKALRSEAAGRNTPQIGDVGAADNEGRESGIARPDQVSVSTVKPIGPANAPLPRVVTDRAVSESVEIQPRATVIALRPAAAEVDAEYMPSEQRAGSSVSAAHQKIDPPTAFAQADVIDPNRNINIRSMRSLSVQKDLGGDLTVGAPDKPVTGVAVMDGGDAVERQDGGFSGVSEATKALPESPAQYSRSNQAQGPDLAHQIAARLTDLGPGQHLVRLSPEELGTVTFRITHDDAGVTILVAAERPEIMQMMRRHVDIMMADLAKSGLADAQLEFDDGGHHRAHHERRDKGEVLPVAQTDGEQASPAQFAGGGLNIRM